MPPLSNQALPLQDWCVLSLRPRNQHAGLRAAAARWGARVLAMSPITIQPLDDHETRAQLQAALACDIVLFTSRNAVHCAAALLPLQARDRQPWLAVGEGSRRALQRIGIPANAPARMDSEGLLALPVLQAMPGRRVGLVTAPGGRGKLVPALQARGATVVRADVYARQTVALPEARLQALQAALQASERVLLPLSSAEALHALLPQLPAPLQARLRRIAVSAASPRLAEIARTAGFQRIVIAANAQPMTLLRAAAHAFV